MIPVTAKSFLDILLDSDPTELSVQERLTIPRSGKQRRITSCSFESVEFQNGVSGIFEGCSFNSVDIDLSAEHSVRFYGCDFQKLNIFGATKGNRRGQVSLRPLKSVSQNKASRVGELTCAAMQCDLELTQLVIGSFILSGGEDVFINFDECCIEKKTELSGACNVTFSKCSLDDSLVGTSMQGKVDILGSKIRRGVSISGKALEDLRLTIGGCDISDIKLRYAVLFLDTQIACNFECGDSQIAKLAIIPRSNALVATRTFQLTKCEIQKHSIVELRNISIDNFELSHLVNDGTMKMRDSRVTRQLEIVNCNMGHWVLQNVDLSKVGCSIILKSDLSQSEFFTVSWMNKYELKEVLSGKHDKEGMIQDYLSLKETYRQLKSVAKESLNQFDYINFQANEQRILLKILSLKGPVSDWLLLLTNRYFNGFGLSYTLPFMWLVATHLLWFLLLVCFGEVFSYEINFYKPDWSSMVLAFSDFVYTIFPLHGTDYLNDSGGSSRIVDSLMRLSSGYFIFYFVSATRKFHTK